MAFVCMAIDRRTSYSPQEYRQLAVQSPASGRIASIMSGHLLDFTDPTRMRASNREKTFTLNLISRGDLNHGFPNPQAMTNFVRWANNFICLSEGLIWTISFETNAWNVVAIQNEHDFVYVPNSRNDLLAIEGDRLTLVKFLPNRANCDRVVIHDYNLSLNENRQINPPTPPSTTDESPEYANIPLPRRPTTSVSVTAVTNDPVEAVTDLLDDLSTSSTNAEGVSNFSSCKICLFEYTSRARSAIIPCGHVACSECIVNSRRENNRCPFCRRNIQNTLRLYE